MSWNVEKNKTEPRWHKKGTLKPLKPWFSMVTGSQQCGASTQQKANIFNSFHQTWYQKLTRVACDETVFDSDAQTEKIQNLLTLFGPWHHYFTIIIYLYTLALLFFHLTDWMMTRGDEVEGVKNLTIKSGVWTCSVWGVSGSEVSHNDGEDAASQRGANVGFIMKCAIGGHPAL